MHSDPQPLTEMSMLRIDPISKRYPLAHAVGAWFQVLSSGQSTMVLHFASVWSHSFQTQPLLIMFDWNELTAADTALGVKIN